MVQRRWIYVIFNADWFIYCDIRRGLIYLLNGKYVNAVTVFTTLKHKQMRTRNIKVLNNLFVQISIKHSNILIGFLTPFIYVCLVYFVHRSLLYISSLAVFVHNIILFVRGITYLFIGVLSLYIGYIQPRKLISNSAAPRLISLTRLNISVI